MPSKKLDDKFYGIITILRTAMISTSILTLVYNVQLKTLAESLIS